VTLPHGFEIVEGKQVVLRHTLAFGVHPTELPLRNRVAVLGGILQRRKRTGGALRDGGWGRRLLRGDGRRGLHRKRRLIDRRAVESKRRREHLHLRKFESLPSFGGGVVNFYLQHREAALKFNSALSGPLLRLEFCLKAAVNF